MLSNVGNTEICVYVTRADIFKCAPKYWLMYIFYIRICRILFFNLYNCVFIINP